jgi:hypothetical protein
MREEIAHAHWDYFIQNENAIVEFIFQDQWGRQIYDVSSEYEPPAQWDDGLLESFKNKEPENVLEIGGVGKTSVRFPQASITVINSNKLLYQICKERGVNSIFIEDYSELDLDTKFDIILINPFIFPRNTRKESEFILSGTKRLLSENGIIVCSVIIGSDEKVSAKVMYGNQSSSMSQRVFSYEQFAELADKTGLTIHSKHQERFKCYFVLGEK